MSQYRNDSDSKLLEKFGYKQDLKRSMKRFSSFAISFSLISILTGISANFHFGYSQVQGVVIFSWLLVFCGQFLVALVMSDLAVRYPLSGYGYQWASRLVNSKLGYATGWLLLMQFLTGFPGICKALGIILSDFFLQFFSFEINSTLIAIGFIWIVAFIHKKGIKIVSHINNLGVITEIIGVIIVIMMLSYFLNENTNEIDFKSLYSDLNFSEINFKSFALSILLGAWCLTGFEAAADMSEETKNPTGVVPKSIINSLIYSGFFGLIIILLSVVFLQKETYLDIESENLLYDLFIFEFGKELFLFVLIFIIAAIFACAVACMATASRLIFSMSRDSVLPKSKWLRSIDKNKSPSNSIYIISLLGSLFILFFKQIEIITSVSAICGYIGYCGIIFSSFFTKKERGTKSFYFSKFQTPIKIISMLWCLFVVICLIVPGQNIDGFSTEYIPAISTFVFLVIGYLIYLIKNRAVF